MISQLHFFFAKIAGSPKEFVMMDKKRFFKWQKRGNPKFINKNKRSKRLEGDSCG
jgi:hypothetical protein